MEEDPLNSLGNLRARTAHQILRAFAHMQARERELRLPIYAHHGTRDRLADVQVGRCLLCKEFFYKTSCHCFIIISLLYIMLCSPNWPWNEYVYD
jgi:hypothetical protein